MNETRERGFRRQIKPVAFPPSLSSILSTPAEDLASEEIIVQSVQQHLNEIKSSVSSLSHSSSPGPGVGAVGWNAQIKAGAGSETAKSITEAGKHQHMHTPAHGRRDGQRNDLDQFPAWRGDKRSDTCPTATPKYCKTTCDGREIGKSIIRASEPEWAWGSCWGDCCYATTGSLGMSQCPYVDLNSLQW